MVGAHVHERVPWHCYILELQWKRDLEEQIRQKKEREAREKAAEQARTAKVCDSRCVIQLLTVMMYGTPCGILKGYVRAWGERGAWVKVAGAHGQGVY